MLTKKCFLVNFRRKQPKTCCDQQKRWPNRCWPSSQTSQHLLTTLCNLSVVVVACQCRITLRSPQQTFFRQQSTESRVVNRILVVVNRISYVANRILKIIRIIERGQQNHLSGQQHPNRHILHGLVFFLLKFKKGQQNQRTFLIKFTISINRMEIYGIYFYN